MSAAKSGVLFAAGLVPDVAALHPGYELSRSSAVLDDEGDRAESRGAKPGFVGGKEPRPGFGGHTNLIIPKLGIILPNMGMVPPQALSVSAALFSKVQQRVLALIFGHPERSFYMSEIVRKVRSGTGAVERELSRLQGSGLVSVERIGNQKHYRANPQSPIFEELHNLVIKTVAVAEPIRRSLQPYSDKIKTAFVYGSVAKGTDKASSDIDLMVIGDELNYSELYSASQTAEDALGRKVSPTFLSPRDWQRKISNKNSFIRKISALPKIFVFGSENDLRP